MQTTNSVKVSFLFGSGISIPAGYPKTDELTQRVLSARDVVRHTDGNYYLSSDAHPGLPNDYVPRVMDFLEILLREAKAYYGPLGDAKTVNYEDLAFMASQIADSESLEYDNPAIKPLTDKILNEVETIVAPTEDRPTHREWSLWEVAEECVHYIKDITWHSLVRSPKRLDHLRMIRTACQHLEDLDIFTLNHDTMLEHFLRTEYIDYGDGFGPAENGVRYWDSYASCSGTRGVRLYKLHGSVDWFRLRPRGSSWRGERVGIPQDWDFWHTKGSDGQLQWPTEGRPVFLTGTFNKMMDYTSSPYFDLHCAFIKRLRQTRTLLVCGYSFNDKAINRHIIEWVYDRNERKLIVCHPNPDGLRDNSRGAVKHKWDGWREENILTVIPKYIQQLTWSEIQSHLL